MTIPATFAAYWQETVYGRVPIQAGIPQLHADLTGLADNDPVYSDCLLHLPVLQWFSSKCDHVTEFGVRNVVSTLALLAGARKRVISYDIKRTENVDLVLAMSDLPVPWEFHEQSSIDPGLRIEKTDMLFIDSVHTGEQVRRELEQHWDSVGKYVAFHDIEAFRHHYNYTRTILDFVDARQLGGETIRTVYETTCNNGLLILEKT